MNGQKWSLKKILIWGAVALIVANSFWTIMHSKISATTGEFGTLSARVAELEKGAAGALEQRIVDMEKKIEEMISGSANRLKLEEARKKAISEQIKLLEQELKSLEVD